jgi:hypothetical protein
MKQIKAQGDYPRTFSPAPSALIFQNPLFFTTFFRNFAEK